MNPRMWAHPATRANAETLRARGVELIGPDEGETAEGEWGVGPDGRAGRDRRAASSSCSRRGDARRQARPRHGRRHARAARRGPVRRQPLVRAAWASRSPRRPGAAAPTSLLAANLAVPAPPGVETIPTPTAEAMLDAALALADVDIALLAAAVADYRPADALGASAPKSASRGRSSSSRPTDIAGALGERKRPGQLLVAFGAELGEAGLERKRAMLDDKNADLVVYNDVSRTDIGFDSKDNEVVLITREGEKRVAKAPKSRSRRRSSTRRSR